MVMPVSLMMFPQSFIPVRTGRELLECPEPSLPHVQGQVSAGLQDVQGHGCSPHATSQPPPAGCHAARICRTRLSSKRILPVTLAEQLVEVLLSMLEREGNQRVTVNLHSCRNTFPDATMHSFYLDPANRQVLLEGLDPITVATRHLEDIAAFHQRDGQLHPWIWRSELQLARAATAEVASRYKDACLMGSRFSTNSATSSPSRVKRQGGGDPLPLGAGLGIALEPKQIVRNFRRASEVAFVPLSDPWAKRQFVLCALDFDALAPPARLLLEHLSPVVRRGRDG